MGISEFHETTDSCPECGEEATINTQDMFDGFGNGEYPIETIQSIRCQHCGYEDVY